MPSVSEGFPTQAHALLQLAWPLTSWYVPAGQTSAAHTQGKCRSYYARPRQYAETISYRCRWRPRWRPWRCYRYPGSMLHSSSSKSGQSPCAVWGGTATVGPHRRTRARALARGRLVGAGGTGCIRGHICELKTTRYLGKRRCVSRTGALRRTGEAELAGGTDWPPYPMQQSMGQHPQRGCTNQAKTMSAVRLQVSDAPTPALA